MSQKNIFIVGLDEFNLNELKQLDHAKEYEFHALCNKEELQQAEGGSFNEILDLCRKRLNDFEGSIDSIIAYWDFPAEAIAPILRKEYDMPYTTLESLEKCEHKYWSRVAQQKVVPENVPQFQKIDPFDDKALENLEMEYPFWLKPVNSFSSYLGFKINNAEEFEEKLAVVRQSINDIAEPYDELLDKVSLPYGMHDVKGHYCIAEEIISGEMFATCGYVFNGEVEIYGLVDVVRLSNESTLSRLQYPTRMPEDIQKEAIEIAKKVMSQIEFDNSAFHIEFFYNEEQGKLWILEINPRISQSHSELFLQVDGDSDLSVPIDISLGIEPRLPHRKGEFPIAAKCYVRTEGDAYVEAVPKESALEELNEEYPDVLVHIQVNEGMKLSDNIIQDSYTYLLADIYLGAANENELLEKKKHCEQMLPFKLSKVQK